MRGLSLMKTRMENTERKLNSLLKNINFKKASISEMASDEIANSIHEERLP